MAVYQQFYQKIYTIQNSLPPSIVNIVIKTENILRFMNMSIHKLHMANYKQSSTEIYPNYWLK